MAREKYPGSRLDEDQRRVHDEFLARVRANLPEFVARYRRDHSGRQEQSKETVQEHGRER